MPNSDVRLGDWPLASMALEMAFGEIEMRTAWHDVIADSRKMPHAHWQSPCMKSFLVLKRSWWELTGAFAKV